MLTARALPDVAHTPSDVYFGRMTSFGRNLTMRREAAGYRSQRALAKALGTDATRVSEWENDHHLPGRRRREQLAALLGCTVSDFFAGVPHPQIDRSVSESASLEGSYGPNEDVSQDDIPASIV